MHLMYIFAANGATQVANCKCTKSFYPFKNNPILSLSTCLLLSLSCSVYLFECILNFINCIVYETVKNVKIQLYLYADNM